LDDGMTPFHRKQRRAWRFATRETHLSSNERREYGPGSTTGDRLRDYAANTQIARLRQPRSWVTAWAAKAGITLRAAALGSAMLIADAPCLIAGEQADSYSLRQSTHAPALPFLAADRFSQKKIFEDELAVNGRK
jgi:hypothetical protein